MSSKELIDVAEKERVSGVATQDDVSSAVATGISDRVKYVDNITELRALTGLVNGQAVEMLTTGRAGLFRFDDVTDYSAEVAADTQEGVYVSVTSGGVLVRQYGQSLTLKPIINDGWFGVDESSDESDSLGAALNMGGIVYLSKDSYSPSSQIPLSTSVEIIGKGSTSITAPSASILFDFTGDDFSITGISGTGLGLIDLSDDFNSVTIERMKWQGEVDSVLSILCQMGVSVRGGVVNIQDIETFDCSTFYADAADVRVLNIINSSINDAPRWCVRSMLIGGANKTGKIIFRGNSVKNINGNMVDKSEVARVIQADVEDAVYIDGNMIDGLESTTASNVLYIRDGSGVVSNNIIKNIKGSSSTSIIDDKGSQEVSATLTVTGNTFDQSGILASESPESVVRINEKLNSSVVNNKFIGLTCFAARWYHSIDTGNYPEGGSFIGNEVIDHDHPVIVQIFQNIKKISVKSNSVFSMSNSGVVSISGETRTRLVDIYQTFDNGFDLEDVVIEGNSIHRQDSSGVVLTIYRNVSAVTSDITGVSVINNEIKEGTSFVRFKTSTMAPVDIINNVAPVGASESIGTEPALCRKVNNVIT